MDRRNRHQAWQEAPRHRSHVGPPWNYDVTAAMQFNVLTHLGLREHHLLLDIGCGSLRAGRLFIPYLQPEHYYGIEHEQWLVEEGIAKELGEDAVRLKRPTFSYNDDFRLTVFDREFDFMLAHSIFTHTDQSQTRTILDEAGKALKEDGVFAATYIPADFDYDGEGWADRASYRPEFMTGAAAQAGLAVDELEWPHPNVRQKWLVLRRASAAA